MAAAAGCGGGRGWWTCAQHAHPFRRGPAVPPHSPRRSTHLTRGHDPRTHPKQARGTQKMVVDVCVCQWREKTRTAACRECVALFIPCAEAWMCRVLRCLDGHSGPSQPQGEDRGGRGRGGYGGRYSSPGRGRGAGRGRLGRGTRGGQAGGRSYGGRW